ncbi:MAG: ATP-dependent Clp protease proteolytic subunit [Acidobacteriia bacterium]|nr:ATP-dependent Clp protease proteolytic subunit [Terriglobia bacterium]
METNSSRRFTVTAKADKTVEIYLYDEIGQSFWGEGITARDFAKQLNAIEKADSILLRINSPGGDVFQASAIHDLITQNFHPRERARRRPRGFCGLHRSHGRQEHGSLPLLETGVFGQARREAA